ncbi:MAG: ATPase [Pyrinomonadaceae bacterium]|nr:ATPase [Pyrinomonadaceae bacterium]
MNLGKTMPMKVKKANGELAVFDEEKIRNSLVRVNASARNIERVIEVVKGEIYDAIPTDKLYRIVFRELKKLRKGVAGKYNLKRAMMALGPTGYPFEKFIGALWESDGFNVRTGQVVKGACVSHEIDVVAKKRNLTEFVECKHHSSNGNVCTVRNPLYFYARFLDIERREVAIPGNTIRKFKGWLVTNMRFTSEALSYGTCVGLGLLSWNFPPNNGLRERIDRAGLHPITCLTSVSRPQKKKLMDLGITLCSNLCERPEVLSEIGIRGSKAEKVIEEAVAVCGAEHPLHARH